jgi:hypothetical protein
MKKLLCFVSFLFFISLTIVPLMAADESPVMVGRIQYIEGSLLRYVTAENDWVAAVIDAPFGTGDTLYTGSQGQAEFVVPNGTWVRVGDNTQVQFIGLDLDVSEVDVASGLARFYNKDNDLILKATSPFGYVLVYPGGAFDYYVGENSAEVVPVKGKISFVHAATNARYEISAGNPSILADQNQVTSQDGGVDPNWDEWNKTRERFWASKVNITGPSAQYLPPALRNDAYVFEENGRWEKVHYEGTNRWFWRPTRVPAGWTPFTYGRWTEWYGDQTWVPNEPFGYTTHHYGNWIFAQNHWYWAPPVARATIGLPLLNIGFFWNPGRVSWIHHGSHVGWVPLAPRETYYSHHRWGGPHVVYVTQANMRQINVHPRNYAYARHAVVVPQKNFYSVNNYKTVRVTNINNTTIIDNYSAAPVVDNTVINNYSTIKQRHNFANVEVKEKPHKTTVERINTNQRVIQQGKREKGSVLEQQVKSIQEGKVNREAKIQQPKVTNLIVPANEVNRPKSEIKLQQKELKKTAREAKEGPVEPGKPSPKIDKPTAPQPKPEGAITPVKPGRPSTKPEAIAPEKPDQTIQKPERVKPARPRPAEKTEDATPAKVAPKPESVAPVKPVVTKPEKVAPAKPTPKVENEPIEKPVSKKERVTPAKPAKKMEGEIAEKPVPKKERIAPVKPTPKVESEPVEKPAPKKERVTPAKVRPADKQKGDTNEQEKPR